MGPVDDPKIRQRERHRRWVEAHPERAKAHALNWYYAHRDEVLARNQRPDRKALKAADSKRRQQDPAFRARRRELYRLSAEKWRAKQRTRAATPEGKAYAREYQRRRRRQNFSVHFMNWLRGAINRSFRKQGETRSKRTVELLGCTPKELMAYLETQFEPGMDWSTPRTWDADHIVPVSAFRLEDPEEAAWAFNYRNLRPLARLANKLKAATLPVPLPSWLPGHIAERLIKRRGSTF